MLNIFIRKRKFTLSSFAVFVLGALFLSGCNVPFTDKTVTLPLVEKKPEKVLEEALVNLFDMKQVHIASDISLGSSSTSGDVDMTLLSESDIDNSNSSSPRSQSTYTYSTGMSGFDFSISGASRYVDGIAYIKFDSLPGLGILNALTKFTGQWYRIDPEEIENSELLSAFSDLPLNDFSNPASTYKSLTEQQKAEMRTLTESQSFLIFQERLPDEKLDGVNTYHYRVTVNQDTITKYIEDASQILGTADSADTEVDSTNVNAAENTETSTTDVTVSNTNTNSGSNVGLVSLLESVQINNMEVWVGKKDFRVRKIVGTAHVEGGTVSELTSSSDVQAAVLFSNYGKPVAVEVPENAKSIEEFVNNSLNSLNMNTSQDSETNNAQ